jgi:hypothetical protein
MTFNKGLILWITEGIQELVLFKSRAFVKGWFSKYSRLYNNWYSLADKSGKGLSKERDWSYLSLFENRTELLICDHWSVLVALRCYTGYMQLQLCSHSFLIVLCSTILNYIYHLCALEVVASGIDDIIVQTAAVGFPLRLNSRSENSGRLTTRW